MAESETEICNLAISHHGIAKEIANLSENSNEANACRRFYSVARDKTLRDFPWPFATQFADLALVEADPTEEWAYSYRYPSDCVFFRRIPSGVRNDNLQSRVPYIEGRDSQGKLLYTDTQNAKCEYTFKETVVNRFDSDFVMALSYLLAAYITPRMTGSDRFKMVPALMQLYMTEIGNARANALNEQAAEAAPESEFIRGRDSILQSDIDASGFRSPF